MLEIDELSAGYGDVQVLWDISLQVDEGELVSIVGNNGAGKTTTLKTIIGWLTPRSGDIRFQGESLLDYEVQERSDLGITIAPEDEGVFPDMTVIDNLRLGAYGVEKGERNERLERVYELFPRLEERAEQYADTLSGGERRMLNIGSALMSDPDMLLVDEPSLGLAPMLASDIIDEIERINEQGTTVLLVEQSVNQALEISDRAYVIENGRITTEGDADEMRESEDMREAYLGM
jgi:branched-chain amino acid transport system ATP-binding protein